MFIKFGQKIRKLINNTPHFYRLKPGLSPRTLCGDTVATWRKDRLGIDGGIEDRPAQWQAADNHLHQAAGHRQRKLTTKQRVKDITIYSPKCILWEWFQIYNTEESIICQNPAIIQYF